MHKEFECCGENQEHVKIASSVTPHIFVESYKYFRGKCCPNLQGRGVTGYRRGWTENRAVGVPEGDSRVMYVSIIASPRASEFDPRVLHVGFLTDKWHWETLFS
jgi:hypothetical protein